MFKKIYKRFVCLVSDHVFVTKETHVDITIDKVKTDPRERDRKVVLAREDIIISYCARCGKVVFETKRIMKS